MERRGAMAVPISDSWERAVSRGTRTHTGEPGPKYWQQWADYRLEAELNPVSKRLTGKGTVVYQNHSPDTLREVYVQLLHNILPRARGITPTFPGHWRASSSTGSRPRARI